MVAVQFYVVVSLVVVLHIGMGVAYVHTNVWPVTGNTTVKVGYYRTNNCYKVLLARAT